MSKNAGGKKGKRQRAHKVSKGINGATHHPLSGLEKVLLGKGQLEDFRGLDGTPWKGTFNVRQPYNAEQVEENRLLYPHLFRED
jgi:hypothetical protein